MKKIKYLLKRITNMSYKGLFDTINYINKKTKKNKIKLFFDIVYCGIKYQAGYMDYKLFEMYTMNKQQRSTVVTRGINNEIIKKLNNKEDMLIFNDKIKFNEKFNKQLNRDWLELTENNYNDFKNFVDKHNEFIAKPTVGSCGKGVEKILVKNQNLKTLHQELLDNKQILVEEVAVQTNSINELHPYSINTLRIVTINAEVVTAYLRIGNNKNIVDNFNKEGLVAPINIETGTIDYKAIDKQDHLYKKHPVTRKSILGFEVPNWNSVTKYIENVAKIIPTVGYVGWDVCLTEDGPILIEGNEFPGHDLYQLPPHRTNNQGLLPIFQEKMQKGEIK